MPIYPEDQVGENFFDLYYYPFKKQIWGAAAIVAVVVLGSLTIRQMHRGRLDDQWDRYRAAIEIRQPSLFGKADAAIARQQIETLRQLINDYPADSVTPSAWRAVVDAQAAAGDYDEAITTLDQLGEDFPDYPLNTLAASGEAGSRSLSAELRANLVKERDWEAETTYVHPTTDPSRMVLVETDKGAFWMGLFTEASSERVAAFVDHAKAGDFNGTQIYEVRLSADGAPQQFRAGSRASITERNPKDHDRAEPLHAMEPGESRHSIRHLYGVVSSVETAGGEDDQSFMVITAKEGLNRYNGTNTPFGQILDREDSLAVIDRIARAQTYSTNPETTTLDGSFDMRDHPYPRLLIRRVSIWADEKLEGGHADFGVRAGSATPEPWEADLAPAPLPTEFQPKKEDAPGAPGADEPEVPETPKDSDSGDEPADETGDDGDASDEAPSGDE